MERLASISGVKPNTRAVKMFAWMLTLRLASIVLSMESTPLTAPIPHQVIDALVIWTFTSPQSRGVWIAHHQFLVHVKNLGSPPITQSTIQSCLSQDLRMRTNAIQTFINSGGHTAELSAVHVPP
jgi:hypothetical protein